MRFPQFLGGSNVAAAISASAERSVNVFGEVLGMGPTARLVMYRTPGLGLQVALPDSPNRGSFAINGRCFKVAGGSFFELMSPTSAVLRGTFPTGTSPVSLADNSVQICMVADGLGYIFNLASNTFTQITGQNGFPLYAHTVTSIDTYFIVLGTGNQFAVSAPLDGTTWSGLSFGSSQEPDNAVAVAQSHLYLWIFGGNSTVIFQDAGVSTTPFQRVPGSQIEQGCGAAFSVATLDNTLFWLGDDSRGPAIVYRADGFLPTRISTHAVEWAIQQYPRRDDAVAYAYQESGHVFYVLTFPSANNGAGATWAYDVATGLWHERGYWNLATGTYSAHRGRFHCFAFGMHLVSDYTSGNVYQMAGTLATDNGNPLRWLRAAPHINKEGGWLFYSAFQLDMQVGGGLPDGSQSQVCLRWSNDGGFTWSNEVWASAGALGAYLTRVIWRRLGRARSRVFEASGSDPVPVLCLQDAYIDVEAGAA